MKAIQSIRGLAAQNLTEVYTYLLLAVGLPAVAYLYFGLSAAVAAFVLPQLAIGLLALRLK